MSEIQYKEKKYRLATFFDAHWDDYVKSPTKIIKPEHYKAVNALRVCRTEKLGKEIYVCAQCGEISEVFHSCKNRFCPTCSWKDTIKWAEKAYTKLLNIPHRHAVATIPHQLNKLFADNYRLLNNALFIAASDTIKDWFFAKFGIIPGIMSVLHTFGEKKNQHNHVHMIVSMGGVERHSKVMKKVALNYIPYAFLSKKFQIKFEDKLLELFDNNELVHQFNSKTELLKLLKQINKQNWRFHFEPPMNDPQMVIK
jgi:DNA-directed RNA polymerase subunit RPC12/RpoP